MSVKVTSWVWDHSRTKKNDKLLMLAIADNANEDGTHAWPSNTELQRKTGLSQRGVRMAIAECVRVGELHVEYNAGPGGTNRYTVIMTGGTPAKPARGKTCPPAKYAPGNPCPPEPVDSEFPQVNEDSDGPPAKSASPQIVPGEGANSAHGIIHEPSDKDLHPREAVAAVAARLPRLDEDDSSSKDPDRIPRLVVELIIQRTKVHIDLDEARRVAADLLDGREVANPVAYVRQALRQEPDPLTRFALRRPAEGTLQGQAGDSACRCLGSRWADNPDGPGVVPCPDCSPSTARRTA